MSEPVTARDAASLPVEGLESREFAPRPKRPFRVRIDPAVHEAVRAHGAETLDREVCGVFLGRLFRDSEGPFLEVSEAIRGEHARSEGAQVTFTHETWNHIHAEIHRRHPAAPPDIVGWYHTHPGFGIFLSEMDLFIHSNFFSGPAQVAFVLDPKAGTEGTFGWVEGEVRLLPSHWIGPVESRAGAGPEATAGAAVPPDRPRDPDEVDVAGTLTGMRTTTLLALAAGLMLGWVSSRFLAAAEIRAGISAAAEAEVAGLVRARILVAEDSKDLASLAARARELASRLPEDPPGAAGALRGPRAAALEIAAEAEAAARRAEDRNRAVSRALSSGRPFVRTGDIAAQVDLQGTQIRRTHGLVMLLVLRDEAERAASSAKEPPERAAERRAVLLETATQVVRLSPELDPLVREMFPGLLPDPPAAGPGPAGEKPR